VLSPEWNEIRFSRWMTHEAIQACIQHEMTPMGRYRKAVQNTQHVLRLEQLTIGLRKSGALRVLDFGCGYGEFLAMCSQYGYEAVGVDRSTAKRVNSSHATIFSELDELTAEMGTKKFHAITLFETLEHLDDPRSVLDELTKLIEPGGILVLETPDCTGVTDITNADESWRIQPLDHINGFTPATLCSLAQRCGYRPIRKPGAHVTTGLRRMVKTEARRLLAALRLLRPTTQQYFAKD
jgi:SAM-dependent methyltransferase